MEERQDVRDKNDFIVARIRRDIIAGRLEGNTGVCGGELYNPDKFTDEEMEKLAQDMADRITLLPYWAALDAAIDRDIERHGLLICEDCLTVFEPDQDFIVCPKCREVKTDEA